MIIAIAVQGQMIEHTVEPVGNGPQLGYSVSMLRDWKPGHDYGEFVNAKRKAKLSIAIEGPFDKEQIDEERDGIRLIVSSCPRPERVKEVKFNGWDGVIVLTLIKTEITKQGAQAPMVSRNSILMASLSTNEAPTLEDILEFERTLRSIVAPKARE
jgi:hypothetical protein